MANHLNFAWLFKRKWVLFNFAFAFICIKLLHAYDEHFWNYYIPGGLHERARIVLEIIIQPATWLLVWFYWELLIGQRSLRPNPDIVVEPHISVPVYRYFLSLIICTSTVYLPLESLYFFSGWLKYRQFMMNLQAQYSAIAITSNFGEFAFLTMPALLLTYLNLCILAPILVYSWHTRFSHGCFNRTSIFFYAPLVIFLKTIFHNFAMRLAILLTVNFDFLTGDLIVLKLKYLLEALMILTAISICVLSINFNGNLNKSAIAA